MQETSTLLRRGGSAERGGPRPVLMVPLRRCGSHAIRLRLNAIPRFYSPYPLHIIDFMPLVGLYGDLNDDRTYFQLVVDLIGLQNATMVKWDRVALDPVTIFDAVAAAPRSAHAVAWQMLIQAGREHGAEVVMDKSLDSIRYAEECLGIHPELLFLNIVRDPRAQVASMNRAIIHDFDTVLNALTWVHAHDMVQALAERHPDRVLTVRYEDLVLTPEPVLRRICAFLGLEYSDTILDAMNGDEARRIAARSELWGSNDKSLNSGYIDKYLNQLARDEIERIESLAGAHMRRYGYEFHTPAEADITPRVLEAAGRRSEAAEAAAWRDLQRRDPRDYQLRRYRAWYLESVRTRLLAAQGRRAKATAPAGRPRPV